MDVASRIPGAQTMRVSGNDTVSDLPLARDRRRDRPIRCRRRSPGCPRERPRDCRFHRHRRLNGSRRQDRRPRLARAAVPPPRDRPPAARPLPRPRARHGRRRVLRDLRRPGTRDPGSASDRRRGVRTLGLEARIGIHVGECELHEGKIAGLAVNIGARVAVQRRRKRGARLADRPGPRRRIRNQLRRSRHPRAQGNTRELAALRGRSRRHLTFRPSRYGHRHGRSGGRRSRVRNHSARASFPLRRSKRPLGDRPLTRGMTAETSRGAETPQPPMISIR